MTIDLTKKNAGGKTCILSIFWFFILSMPATACQPVGTMPACGPGIPEAIKAVGGELSYSKTRGLTSEDLPLINVCLLGQSQEAVPWQRLPAILWWHLCRGGKGTGSKMARCQANITHTFANRNLHTVSRRFRMPSVFSAMASPQGRDPKQRWHHAKRKLGGIHKCHQRLYKTVVNADTK